MRKLFELICFSISFPEARSWIPTFHRLQRGKGNCADHVKAKEIARSLQLYANAAEFAMLGMSRYNLEMAKETYVFARWAKEFSALSA